MYPFSQRLPWSHAPNALSRAAAEKRAAGAALLDLTISNPTGVFPYPHDEIAEALSCCRDFTYRPDPFGLEQARAAVSTLYLAEGVAISTSRIALAASTSEAYALLFKLLCNPGDELLVPVPSYPLFEYLAALEGVRVVPYRLEYDGAWFIDFDNLRAKLSARARAIVIVNPNNPTGSFLRSSECERLFELAAGRGLPVISDEVFLHFEFGRDPARVKSLASFPQILSFALNGLSKAAAMPQMKLAWIVINGPARKISASRERLELLLDTYLSVNTPVQLALPALLEIGRRLREQILARCLINLQSAQATLAGTAAHALHVEGGWSVILQFPNTRSDEEWTARLLAEKNVLLQPGYFFDLAHRACAVASLITPPEIFREGLRRVAEVLAIG